MSTVDKAGRTLRAGFGLAAAAALVLVNACASGNSADNSGSLAEASAETTEAVLAGPVGSWSCTTSNGLVASTLVTQDAGGGNLICRIYSPRLLSSALTYCSSIGLNPTCPDCSAQGDNWGCQWV